MGLLDALKQYWQDASPGGALNPEIPKDAPVLGLLADPMGSIRSTLNKANAQADAHLNKLAAASAETVKTGKWTGPAQQAYQGELGNFMLNTFGPLQTKFVYPQEQALLTAQKNAASTPAERMLQQGYEDGWYHGSTGDIRRFDNGLLGEATGAQSAKKAHFFARDPQNPPAHMTVKAEPNSDSVKMLRELGIPESEIQKLNTVSMQGHGAETASGYAQIGGSREYREAMRKSAAAEKSGNWDEYEKWMQVAEDAEIGRNQQLQSLVAKYGDARDTMLDSVNSAIYSKQLPQAEAEALDAKVKQLMPYGWYNSYSIPQMQGLKSHIASMSDNPQAALKAIDDFISVKAERQLAEHTQEGGNVMPVALRYKNPLVHDFGGSAYRDQSYSDLLDKAIAGGHDAVLMKNTFDPGAGPAKLVDIAAIFNPNQIRSKFAAFDPARMNDSDILGKASPGLLGLLAGGTGAGLAGYNWLTDK